jgi:hypothetical protein
MFFEKFTGACADNLPEAAQASVGPTTCGTVPSATYRSDRKFCDGRADNQQEAARTIDSKNAQISVPRDFPRFTEKVTGCRTDNQPGAVRTSVNTDDLTHCPERVSSSEKIENLLPTPRPAASTLANGRAGWRAKDGEVVVMLKIQI